MFTRNLSIIAVILSICLLCFSGCGSGSSGGGSQGGSSGSQSGNKGTILITAPFPAKAAAAKTAATNTAVKPDKKTIRTSRFIPLTVYIYVVTVCEQGTTTAVVSPVNINRPDSGNTVDASVDDVPVGWKTIRVFAYDSNRNLLAQGASDVEVKSADQGSTEASVTLASTSDPPSVSSTTPSNAQTAVSINAKVTVLFSMSMLGSSLSTDTFYLQSSQGKVEGTVSTDGSTAIFTPSSALLPLTTYTAVVSGNVKNTAGLSMGTDHTWNFTTGEKPDTTPPQVKETSPVSGATSIDTGATISAVFTKNIDPATVTSSTFTVTSSKAAVSGTISTLGNSVTFVPATALQAGAAITVTLSGIIKDLAGNAMGTDYTWSFTTKASESGGGGGGGGGGSVPTKLNFYVQPSTVALNGTITPAVQVKIYDQYGNFMSSATNSVTIAIGYDPSGSATLSGTKTVSASCGIAYFSNLSIDQTGLGFTLVASSSGLTSATSNGFVVGSTTIISDSTGYSEYPHIAMDGLGNAVVVWDQELTTGNHTVRSNTFTASPSPGSWGTASNVSTSSTSSQKPLVVMQSNNNAIALWERKNGGNLDPWVNTYVIGGVWAVASETQLAATNNNMGKFQIATDGGGNATAVWSDDTAGWVSMAEYYTGGAWGAVESMGTGTLPSIAMASGQNPVSLWFSNPGINSSWRTPPWTAATSLSATSTLTQTTRTELNTAGDALGVWDETNGTKYQIEAKVYTGGFWGATALLSTGTNNTHAYTIALGSSSNSAVVVWEEDTGTTYQICANIRTAGAWGGSAVISDGSYSSNPQVVMNRTTGDFIAIWECSGSGIVARKYVSGTGWQSQVTISSSASSLSPFIAMNSAGQAIAVWSEWDGSKYAIVVYHF